MKRLFSALLALLLLLALPAPAWAEEGSVELRTAEDLVRFSRACGQESYSAGRSFVLTADIDLTGSDFQPVPYFAGSFQGGGHTILGLSIAGDGSRQGFFRRTGSQARIADLKLKGSVTPGGTQCIVGGVVGENAGHIEGCSFEGTVVGIEDVGGIAGRNLSGAVLNNCSFAGEVRGEHQVGGVVGTNGGMLYGCTNAGRVNTVPITPHGEKHFDISALSESDFLNLTNIGGIAGSSTWAVLDCVNEGDVGYKLNGYNVGGIAGRSEGLLRGCVNRGDVSGRRDVGGIAGQLIPWSLWDLSEGKLDELSTEIDTLQRMLEQTNADAQNMSWEVRTGLEAMHGYTEDAVYSLRAMMEDSVQSNLQMFESIQYDPETGVDLSGLDLQLPDSSALTSALFNLQGEAAALTGAAASGMEQTAANLSAVTNQISRVMSVVDSTMSGLRRSVLDEIYDLSATETYEHDTGAIDGCSNYGGVNAEKHAGGVVGTSAFEVEFDMEDRLNASEFLLSNAKEYLFAAVRGCKSCGAVSVKSECAGLIAGAMDIGAIVDCVGLGDASAQSGDYIGGVVGRTKGCVRACWSRAELSGGKYIGGVAGLGADIASCRTWAHITQGTEYLGAVAGWAEGSVSDNLYVPDGPDGVDGAALLGQCSPADAAALLSAEGAPEGFDLLSVSFLVDGVQVGRVEVPFGGSIDTLPEVPNRGAAYWKWDDFDREHIYYSREVTGRYYEPNSALSTGEEVPLFLAEGAFYEGQRLQAAAYTGALEGETLGAWTLWVNDYDGTLRVRMYAPEADSLVRRIGENGALEKLSASRDGSYLVFSLDNGGSVALLREKRDDTVKHYAIALIISGCLLLVLTFSLLSRRGKKKKEREAALYGAAPDDNAASGQERRDPDGHHR